MADLGKDAEGTLYVCVPGKNEVVGGSLLGLREVKNTYEQ